MERTIKVTGKGKINVKPDTIRLVLSLEGMKESYEEALSFSTTQTESLKDIFVPLGFERSELKTLSFDIDTQYESYQAKDKSWKRRFLGYKFSHNMKLEFPADNSRLGKVLYALAHGTVMPEFRILYTVKDTEKAKNQLLAKAVEDSKEKAAVLTQAAGVTLGEVQLIDYSWGELEIISTPMNKMMEPCVGMVAESDAAYDIDIEPDDIDISDTVTVVWTIS
jgi:hypothetical protein